MQVFLDRGASINTKSAPSKKYAVDGRETALHLAMQAGRESIVRLLMKRGADAMSQDSEYRTALNMEKSLTFTGQPNDEKANLLLPESRTHVGK